MILTFIADLTTSASILFIFCLVAVCVFEAINGFHDTANAVATVIYTHTLPPVVAVVWSGICNFFGVLFGGIAVAMGIVKLIPLNDLMVQTLGENSAMVLAVLLAAILWNLGTWYIGIPCSSSHTLIGSLLGAGFAFWTIHQGDGVNWEKAKDIGLSLLVSPFFGFTLAIILMFILRKVIKVKSIFKEPEGKKPPPAWVRGILFLTCSLVSFFHGSNDGQKGVGLLLVVLMAFMPIQYAINHQVGLETYKQSALNMKAKLEKQAEVTEGIEREHLRVLSLQSGFAAEKIAQSDPSDKTQLYQMRKTIQSLVKNTDADIKNKMMPSAAAHEIKSDLHTLRSAYEFAPTWAILLISICLGLGTMVGWKRIVVTIGEKIGKTHLTYAQGASAEICAASTIGVSTYFGLPVSTTHVLSSGIAGTMVASGGIANLQRKTVVNIAIAWLLTLPVTFVLSLVLFYLLRLVL